MRNRSREIIDSLGLRKVDIASEMGITSVGLNQILNTDKPKIETLEKLANVINVPVWKLYLTDEEIRDIGLVIPINQKETDRTTGYIEHNGQVHKINSISDIEKLLEVIKEKE